jgi:hypothetical protein
LTGAFVLIKRDCVPRTSCGTSTKITSLGDTTVWRWNVIAPFDLFRVEENGQLRWLAAADTLENAKAHLRAFAESNPALSREYVIFSQATGNRMTIKASDGVGGWD